MFRKPRELAMARAPIRTDIQTERDTVQTRQRDLIDYRAGILRSPEHCRVYIILEKTVVVLDRSVPEHPITT